MKPLIKRKGKFVHVDAYVITYTQFKRDYMDTIDMWDATQRVGWVQWAEVLVKKFGGGGAREPICTTK
jgi:hypothetical protein